MIERIVSGGQTGAGQAGWRAAKAAGIATGGWMPKGFKTEAGPHPEFAEMYEARAHASASYRDRTAANVELADATLVFATNPKSPGSWATIQECYDQEKHSCIVKIDNVSVPPTEVRPPAMAAWLRERNVRSVNVAGNRESKSPGIGEWVERYLAEVFRLLNGDNNGGDA